MQEIENENIKEPTEIKVQNKQLVIPVWERYLMTVLEASEYYHIGENKLRNVIDLHPNTEFLIMNFRTIQQLQCLLFLLRYGAYFQPVGFAYLAGFRCSVSEFGAISDFTLRRFGRRSYSLTLLRDALNIIISKIVNWLGTVIAQSGRQFDESGDCFFGDDVV